MTYRIGRVPRGGSACFTMSTRVMRVITPLPGALPMALTGLLLTACNSTPVTRTPGDAMREGAVGAREIANIAAAPRLELADNESYQPPIDRRDNALPAYPPELLVQRLPDQALCLRIAVSEDGRVSSADPHTGGEACVQGGAVDPRFFAASREAVSSWRFEPAFRCVFHDAAEKQRLGPGCMEEQSVPQSVSLVYRFEFIQRDGRGSVRMGR